MAQIGQVGGSEGQVAVRVSNNGAGTPSATAPDADALKPKDEFTKDDKKSAPKPNPAGNKLFAFECKGRKEDCDTFFEKYGQDTINKIADVFKKGQKPADFEFRDFIGVLEQFDRHVYAINKENIATLAMWVIRVVNFSDNGKYSASFGSLERVRTNCEQGIAAAGVDNFFKLVYSHGLPTSIEPRDFAGINLAVCAYDTKALLDLLRLAGSDTPALLATMGYVLEEIREPGMGSANFYSDWSPDDVLSFVSRLAVHTRTSSSASLDALKTGEYGDYVAGGFFDKTARAARGAAGMRDIGSFTQGEILRIAERAKECSPEALSGIKKLSHITNPQFFTEDQLLARLIELAKGLGEHREFVFEALSSLADIIVTKTDLETKVMKLSEMARSDAWQNLDARILNKHKAAIKKWGISPFAEIAKAGGFHALSFLDDSLVQRYGPNPFLEIARHWKGVTGEAFGALMMDGQEKFVETIAGKIGIEGIVKIVKKYPPPNSDRAIELMNVRLSRVLENVDIALDITGDMSGVERLTDILIKFQTPPASRSSTWEHAADYGRSTEFMELFAEMNQGAKPGIDELEKFTNRVVVLYPDLASILGDFRRITYDKLAKNSNAYTKVFDLARVMGNDIRGMEDAFAKKLDIEQLIKDATSAEKLAVSLRLLQNLNPGLAMKFASRAKVKEDWIRFDHDRIDEKTMAEARDACTIVGAYTGLFPDDKKWLARREALGKQFMGVTIGEMKPIRTLGDLEETFKLAESFNGIGDAFAETLKSSILRHVDFAALIRSTTSGNTLDPKALEGARLKLNEINRVMGDEFILFVGIHMAREPITMKNFHKKLGEVDACCFSLPSSYSDVNNLYRLIGRFQANRIADFFIENKKSFDEKESGELIKRFEKMGLVVDFEDSAALKTMRSLKNGQVGYVIGKGWAKLTAGDALDQKYIDIKIKENDPGIDMRNGFSLRHIEDSEGGKIATVIKGDSRRGAFVSYETGIETGIDVDRLKKRYKNSLVAFAVGAFSTGERKLAEFSANGGSVTNYLISEHDGLVIFYPDGSIDIKNAKTLEMKDLPTPGFHMSEDPLKFDERLGDFDIFVKKIKKLRAGVMQTQLLLHDGELQITGKSSGVSDKRRMLAVMDDGTYALIDFEPRLTLLEGAVLAKKMGARHLVNLDTGMYDFSQYLDRDGKAHKLGTFDSERPTNLVVFHVQR